jgi:predicted nucleotidyltransferase
MRYGLKEDQINKICSIFQKYEQVEAAILYGSRAKGTFRKGSDIDLSLKGEKLNTSILFRIENELDDLLLPYQLDLSILHQIDNDGLLDHIERVGVLFWERQ